MLTELLTGRRRGSVNGAYFDHTGRQRKPAAPAGEAWVAGDLMSASAAMIRPFA